MLRKVISVLLAGICILAFAGVVYADDAVSDGTPLFAGHGTEASPYEISSPDDFLKLAEKVNSGDANYSDANYKLTRSVDLEGINYVPIGSEAHPFTGVFDGGRYIISNLEIEGNYVYSGMFGYIRNADIKNVFLKNANVDVEVVDTFAVSGLIAGYSKVALATETHYITGCSVEGTLNVSVVKQNSGAGSATAGGILGKSETHNNGCFVISDCNADIVVQSSSANSAFAGGIVGVSKSAHTGGSNVATVSKCVSTGKVTAIAEKSWGDAGGIAGWFSQQWIGWSDEYKEDQVATLLATDEYYNVEYCVTDCVVECVTRDAEDRKASAVCGEISSEYFKYRSNFINSGNSLQNSTDGYNGSAVSTKLLFAKNFLAGEAGLDFENTWDLVLGKPVIKTTTPYIASAWDGDSDILKVLPVNCGSCDVYIIAYTNENRVETARMLTYDGVSSYVSTDLSGLTYDSVKIFAVGDNFKPLCIAAVA